LKMPRGSTPLLGPGRSDAKMLRLADEWSVGSQVGTTFHISDQG